MIIFLLYYYYFLNVSFVSLVVLQVGSVYRMCPVTQETALFFFDSLIAAKLKEGGAGMDIQEFQVGGTRALFLDLNA